jgi:hypothetical protein
MPFTNYLKNVVLNNVFGGTAFTPPATLYLGLSTTAVTEAGGGITEPTGGAYARVSFANNKTTGWDTGTGADNLISNLSELTFPEATASWGTITHFFISDAATGGNILVSEALTTAKTISSGGIARFPAGSLDIAIDETI